MCNVMMDWYYSYFCFLHILTCFTYSYKILILHFFVSSSIPLLTSLHASSSYYQLLTIFVFAGFGDNRKAMLQDLAVITGGQVVSEDLGLKLENITEEYLGTCAKIKVLLVFLSITFSLMFLFPRRVELMSDTHALKKSTRLLFFLSS